MFGLGPTVLTVSHIKCCFEINMNKLLWISIMYVFLLINISTKHLMSRDVPSKDSRDRSIYTPRTN